MNRLSPKSTPTRVVLSALAFASLCILVHTGNSAWAQSKAHASFVMPTTWEGCIELQDAVVSKKVPLAHVPDVASVNATCTALGQQRHEQARKKMLADLTALASTMGPNGWENCPGMKGADDSHHTEDFLKQCEFLRQMEARDEVEALASTTQATGGAP